MTFRNSILAGTELVRDAIRSSGYVAGVSGWSIDRDGSAEFNDVDMRGTLVTGPAPGPRIEVSPNGAGSQEEIDFYTGQATESMPALIYDTAMTSGPDRAELLLQSNTFGGLGPAANINLRSGASDGSVDPEIILGADTKCFGVLEGDLANDGARIRMRSANELSFSWDGVNIKFYVDGINVKNL